MAERITDSRLYQKLMNHNAWTNGTLLDIDSLGAGGSKHHLIFANTQTKLGNLMSNSELWDLIDSIGNYEFTNGLQQKDEPNKKFMDEYERLVKGGKYDYYFISDMIEKAGYLAHTPIRGDSL